MRYSDFKKLAAATKTPSATPTNSIPKSTVGAVNMPKQTTLSNTPMVGAAQAKTPTANPAPTTNALPNTNTATAVQDRVKSWVNGPNQQNSMFTKPNYWSKENIAKATQQPQQPQQPQPTAPQPANTQGAITRSVYPMGQGASPKPAPTPMAEHERMIKNLDYGYKNQPTSEQLSALSPEHRQMVEKAMQDKGMMVSPDAFKDAESTKNFVNGMEGNVRANTSTSQQINDVGIIDGALNKIFGKDVPEEDKARLFQTFKQNNPQWFPSLVTAVKNGSPDALKELQKMMGEGSSNANYFSPEEKQQLMSAAQSASWNAIKSDPLTNLPKIAGLFLRSKGWNGAADFAENPVGFYGSALALLFGGGMLLAGGDEEDQPQQQQAYARQPAGYYKIPYT